MISLIKDRELPCESESGLFRLDFLEVGKKGHKEPMSHPYRLKVRVDGEDYRGEVKVSYKELARFDTMEEVGPYLLKFAKESSKFEAQLEEES